MDGRPFDGCPREGLTAETNEMLAYFNDWERGITPVGTGRAPWLPSPFLQAMHAIGNLNAECNAERIRRENRERARG